MSTHDMSTCSNRGEGRIDGWESPPIQTTAYPGPAYPASEIIPFLQDDNACGNGCSPRRIEPQLPSVGEPEPEVSVHDDDRNLQEPHVSVHGKFLEHCHAFPLILYAAARSSDVLQDYYMNHEKRIYRAEQWRVFTSNRPMTQMFKLRWVRVCSFMLGVVTLTRQPYGILQSTWRSRIPNSAIQHAKMLRFSALARRNGKTDWSTPLSQKFGPLWRGCQLDESSVSISHTERTSTMIFPSTVQFDGWYYKTGKDDAQLDPATYKIQYSEDGITWNTIVDSSRDAGCACLPDGAENSLRKGLGAGKRPYVNERNADVLHSFSDVSCLWPYYCIIVALYLQGQSLIVAPFLAPWDTRQALPVQLIAWSSLFAGALKIVALVAAAAKDLALEPMQYTQVGLCIEALVVNIAPHACRADDREHAQ